MQSVKIVLVGDDNVGKTTLLVTHQSKAFPQQVPIVIDNFCTTLSIHGKPIGVGIWDTIGSEDNDRLRPLSYPQADLFIVCFAIDSFSSFQHTSSKWKPEIAHHVSFPPIVLLGTKIDLRTDKQAYERVREENSSLITYEQGLEKAKEIGAYKYLECSAYDSGSVENAIYRAMRTVVGPPSPVLQRRKTKNCILS